MSTAENKNCLGWYNLWNTRQTHLSCIFACVYRNMFSIKDINALHVIFPNR